MSDDGNLLSRWADAGQSDPLRDTAADQGLSSTLMRGLEILALFSDTEARLSNAEIARRLDLNRATVSRLCKTLVHMGYMRRDPKGSFRLAPRVLALSYPVLAVTRWRHQLVGPMREIAAMSSGNVTLAVMSGDHRRSGQFSAYSGAGHYRPPASLCQRAGAAGASGGAGAL